MTGLINTTGPKSCANATRVPSGGGSTPPGTPDLAFNMSPSFLDMTGPVGTTGTLSVSLDEVNNAPTSGAITVRLSALSTGFSYSISNPSWTMGNSGFFTTFTTNNVVSAAGSTSLTITLTKDQSFTGSFPITGQLMSGSGGDTNTGNNGSSVTTVSSTGNSGGGGGGGNTAPVITLTGPNPVSCMTPPNYWDTMLHAEPSFTVTDNEETIPTSAVVISDNYLGLPTNNTIRTYSVTDSGGLSAVPQTRTFTGVCGGGH